MSEVKLLPTDAQGDALRETMERSNAAADWLSGLAFDRGVHRRFELHRLVYYELRARFGLSAQAACLAIGRVAACYKRSRDVRHHFRRTGAVSFDARLLRWQLERGEVSIWTVAGRQRISFVCGERQRWLLGSARIGESDLVLREGRWLVQATCEVEVPKPFDPEEWLGVDLGVVNIATDSDGFQHAGAHLNALRRRHERLRARLQAKQTKSAKRLLRRRARKEARIARDFNHRIAKRIVREAERTRRGIALEDLRGIRRRARASRPQRRALHSWAFRQLRSFVEYKAALAGVPVAAVRPENTSRQCPGCGHTEKANRRSRERFECVVCGLAGPADHIAARNIARRAAVNRPNVSGQCGSSQSHRLRDKPPASVAG